MNENLERAIGAYMLLSKEDKIRFNAICGQTPQQENKEMKVTIKWTKDQIRRFESYYPKYRSNPEKIKEEMNYLIFTEQVTLLEVIEMIRYYDSVMK